MSTVRAKSVETSPLKKTLKKKVLTKETVVPVEKVKKSETKSCARPEVLKKEVMVKTEEVEEKKVVEKSAKKINVKSTLADICGLNLSVAKVKNIISNLCINKETFMSLKEMKEHRVMTGAATTTKSAEEFTFTLSGLSPETLTYLDACTLSINESKGLLYSRKVTRDMSKEDAAKYNEAKRIATASFQDSQKNGHLFQQFEFNLTAFNISYDADFYKGMEDFESGWKSLMDVELYTHCVNVVNKNKVRFNSESKIFITSYVEYIVKQLVINGTKNCIDDKKKIIQLSHALSNPMAEFTMFPFISGSMVYKNYMNKTQGSEDSVESEADAEVETDIDPETIGIDDSSDRKLQFRYYIAELCRNVRMELSAADDVADIESKFNQTSVSRNFKQFCSNMVIELLGMFGSILKVEVQSRQVKTVNYNIIGALVQNTHIIHGLDYAPTVNFIQEKYNIYNTFLTERSLKRDASASSTVVA
jgi:hypothetical protein